MKVPYFLKYGLDWNIIIFIVVMALISAMISSVQSVVISFVLRVIWFSVYFKYTFQVISEISEGNLEPPPLEDVFSGRGFLLFLRMLGVALVFIGIGFFILLTLKYFVLLYAFIVALAWPAIIMIMAKEHNVGEAISPGRIFEMIKTLGGDYINLLIFFAVLNVLPIMASVYLGGESEGASSTILLTIIGLLFFALISEYTVFVFHAMMGYCLYRHQEDLGYDANYDDDYYADEATYIRIASMAECTVLEKEKRYEEAVSRLRSVLEKNPEVLDLNLKYHNLLLLTKEQDRLVRHGQHLIQLLINAKNQRQAAQVYCNVINQASDFTLPTAELRNSVAQGLYSIGKHKETVQLVKDMHKQFPGSYEIPQAYLLAAKALCEGLSQDQLALKYLDFIEGKFPNSPVVKEAKEYREVISRMKH
ncbi:DUF4013 domain-containing protein [Spartinivicinus ruber]|uniref:DUF4013 domain-containing protein n=1 Tax=Spartinivicinus ruber TaxID=2683272 RepID=UPI0013D73324|nr:DUF4013 domain-containing protein [Spartinivicinus ruber]